MKKKGMENIKFFIIVPIYNVESYLKECLDSIIYQTYTEFEAILVDDGSTDSSWAIAEKYVKKDSRLMLIHQENQGVSMARNKGLDVARQKSLIPPPQQESHNTTNKSYIVFVDSDDYLELNALEHISKVLIKENVDILIESHIIVRDEKGGKKSPCDFRVFAPHIKGRYTPKELVENMRGQTLITSDWAFTIRTDFLFKNGIRFIPHIIYEDVPFCTEVAMKAQSLYVDDTCVYNYRLSPNSIMRGRQTRDKKIKIAFSRFKILQYFKILQQEARDKGSIEITSFYESIICSNVNGLIRFLGVVGYVSELGFTKADLKPFLPCIKGKYRFCYHFPIIYAFPKRLRLTFQALWERLASKVMGKV